MFSFIVGEYRLQQRDVMLQVRRAVPPARGERGQPAAAAAAARAAAAAARAAAAAAARPRRADPAGTHPCIAFTIHI